MLFIVFNLFDNIDMMPPGEALQTLLCIIIRLCVTYFSWYFVNI